MRRFLPLLLSFIACGRPTEPVGGDAGSQAFDAGATLDAGTRETKYVFAIADDQSFSVTDPDGQRASSLVTFVNRLPTNTSLLVLTFWGSSLTSLSPSKTPLLSRLSEWSPAARASLQQDLLAHGTNREGTLTFVPLLSALHEVLAADLAKGGSADYELVLVTDGSPSDEDQSLFCGTAVTGLTALGNAKNSVRLSIGHVFHIKQAVPPCTDSIDVTACKVTPPASMCAAGVLAADIARLGKVAALGTGTFTSFEGTTQVDYSALVTH